MSRNYLDDLVLLSKERLEDSSTWFPYPALLSYILAMVFTGHILMGLHPYGTNHTDLVALAGEPVPNRALRIGIREHKNHLVIMTLQTTYSH